MAECCGSQTRAPGRIKLLRVSRRRTSASQSVLHSDSRQRPNFQEDLIPFMRALAGGVLRVADPRSGPIPATRGHGCPRSLAKSSSVAVPIPAQRNGGRVVAGLLWVADPRSGPNQAAAGRPKANVGVAIGFRFRPAATSELSGRFNSFHACSGWRSAAGHRPALRCKSSRAPFFKSGRCRAEDLFAFQGFSGVSYRPSDCV
jgi:hypothetical protein